MDNTPQVPQKHAGGRPSKFDPKIIGEVDKYLETTGRENTHLPKIESFALFLGVSKKTLYNWAKENEEFLHDLEKLMNRQAEQLIDDGMYGGKEVNASIAKLLLSAKHGYVEKVQAELSGSETNPITIKVVADTIDGNSITDTQFPETAGDI